MQTTNAASQAVSATAWTATGLCCAYYLFLLTNGDFELFAPEPLGQIFDHMAWNLLHWRFTIDQEVLGVEAFQWNGNTYSYFGIFPAVLRLPLVLIYGVDAPSLSRLSCWAGLCLIAIVSTSILLRVRPLLVSTPMRDPALALALAATLLTGPLLSLTFAAWIYNEPIVWGTAFALLFFRLLLAQAAAQDDAGHARWLAMGALAGLTFSVRPVPAVAMTIALALAVLLMRHPAPSMPNTATVRQPTSWLGRQTAQVAGMLPSALRAGGAFLPLIAVALLVNWERWGNPLIFAPPTAQIGVIADPHRLRIAMETGVFDLRRLPLGIAYYAFGLNNGWVGAMADRLSDGLGWPRSALIVTAATQLALGLVGCVGATRCWLPQALRGRNAVCLIVMPIAMAGMVLTLIYMNYRYRLEFLPLLVFCGLGGAAGLAAMPRVWARRTLMALSFLLAINVAISHLDLLQAKIASFAQPDDVRERIIRSTWPVSGLFAPWPPGS